jgi:hypothetical protein
MSIKQAQGRSRQLDAMRFVLLVENLDVLGFELSRQSKRPGRAGLRMAALTSRSTGRLSGG